MPDDLLLDNISFLVFLPSKVDPSKSLSSQSKPNIDSIKSRQWPNYLKYLFLKDISIDDVDGLLVLSGNSTIWRYMAFRILIAWKPTATF